ncbi:hypothetical protein PbJCM13498_19340 [Prolixibacter bellariivorans]|uniref:LVIVD repeat-containing protein n=1 Tax=Prolixibacter bellariivorans TaxID=314319 RepID=A0A5M4AZJ6_9BACT|nr:hypothetical protein [Prolixibacter bellariivorans]GET33071.1 hypothetical protein PbJCM13498_19340 [Prolixibacter bellariivorans]
MSRHSLRSLWLLGIIIALFALVLASCTKDDGKSPFDNNTDEDITVVNDDAAFTSRVTTMDEVINVASSSLKSASVVPSNSYTLKLVAHVDAPLADKGKSNKLSASFVQVVGDKAYVTYHRQDDIVKGAFEVIDMSNPKHPEVSSQLTYGNVEFNALCVDDETYSDPEAGTVTRCWLACDDHKDGAVLRELYLEANGDIYEPKGKNHTIQRDKVLDAPSSNAVFRHGDYLYFAAGGEEKTITNKKGETVTLNTGITKIDLSDFSTAARVRFSYAKYAAYASSVDKVVGFEGVEAAKLHLLSPDLSSDDIVNIGDYYYPGNSNNPGTSDNHTTPEYQGKSTITVDGNLVYVSLGAVGLKVFDLTSGDANPTPVYQYLLTEQNLGNVNGVTLFNDDIMIANGADGLVVASIPAQGTDLEILGSYNPDGSVNYVAGTDNYIILAAGTGGLYILQKE